MVMHFQLLMQAGKPEGTSGEDAVRLKESSNLPVKIDVTRMSAALSSQTFTLPRGLSREEKRQHILSSARKSP